jgi:hypothetical protein
MIYSSLLYLFNCSAWYDELHLDFDITSLLPALYSWFMEGML